MPSHYLSCLFSITVHTHCYSSVCLFTICLHFCAEKHQAGRDHYELSVCFLLHMHTTLCPGRGMRKKITGSCLACWSYFLWCLYSSKKSTFEEKLTECLRNNFIEICFIHQTFHSFKEWNSVTLCLPNGSPITTFSILKSFQHLKRNVTVLSLHVPFLISTTSPILEPELWVTPFFLDYGLAYSEHLIQMKSYKGWPFGVRFCHNMQCFPCSLNFIFILYFLDIEEEEEI